MLDRVVLVGFGGKLSTMFAGTDITAALHTVLTEGREWSLKYVELCLEDQRCYGYPVQYIAENENP